VDMAEKLSKLGVGKFECNNKICSGFNNFCSSCKGKMSFNLVFNNEMNNKRGRDLYFRFYN
jgi:hypothetical protein